MCHEQFFWAYAVSAKFIGPLDLSDIFVNGLMCVLSHQTGLSGAVLVLLNTIYL